MLVVRWYELGSSHTMGLYTQKYPKLQFAHGQFCSKDAKVVANGPPQQQEKMEE